MRGLPKINAGYWLTLMAASTFGTNTGDFVSDTLHIGHLAGLPWLALALGLVFSIERWSAWANPLFFWLVIIIVRTAATNVGDAFHDFDIGFGTSLPLVLALFTASVAAYARFSPRRSGDDAASVRVSPLYWLCMGMAGILGTIGGDFMSFGAHLSPAGTAIAFSALAAAAIIYWGRDGRLYQPAYYWIALALIRTAGTGAGDALAHDVFGLPLATVATGLVFLGLVGYFYLLKKDNQSLATLAAT